VVGLRGYKLDPAVKRYLAAGLAVQEARRKPPHRQHRIAKRWPAGTLQELVAEYVAGTPAAELGRRYGVAKSTVLTVLRVAGVSVRYPRLSAADGARVVELYGQGLPQTEIAARWAEADATTLDVLHDKGSENGQMALIVSAVPVGVTPGWWLSSHGDNNHHGEPPRDSSLLRGTAAMTPTVF
jgi:hypothetical protein